MASQTKLNCSLCNKSFLKPTNEYNRRIRLGKKEFFCCRSCASKTEANIKHIRSHSTDYDISQHAGNVRDELTPFRYLFKIMHNKRRKEKSICVSLEDLKDIWERQKGLCPYTGIKLTPPTHVKVEGIKFYQYASVDRIDSSQHYTKDNIEFISRAVNWMKNKHSKEEVIEFLNIVRTN